MARMARTVFEGVPHHVTQRGNGRGQTFFSEADYQLYRDLLAENAAKAGWRFGDGCSCPTTCT